MKLLTGVEKHLDEIISDITCLVETETYSTDLKGLDDGADKIKKILTARLGANIKIETIPAEGFGDHLVVTVPGTSGKKALFVGHYDTVWPQGTLVQWQQREKTDATGRRQLSGPGIFDMKTGLVQAIWVTKVLQEWDLPRPTITLLINGDEEIGSPSSRALIEDHAKGSDMAFVFEASHEGKVKTSRKGVGLITVEAIGVESHAGLNPGDGASAITALMEWCLEAVKLANPVEGTTVNVGLISGGTGSNVVAGKATAKLDIRIRTFAEQERLDVALDQIEWTDDRVKINVTKGWNRPPMEFTPASQDLYRELETTALEMGKSLEHTAVGGASDANFIAPLGIPVICGIGADGAGAHARHEFIYPDSIPFFIALVAGTVSRLA
ncbi:M20 family metallopeptidase [Corynebacterium hindlerae]|uniref:M20 family metallopeptidase n=1 Tax=Corynebacterium hindlerae TaxID=699041 RepID=UPI003AAFD8FD